MEGLEIRQRRVGLNPIQRRPRRPRLHRRLRSPPRGIPVARQ